MHQQPFTTDPAHAALADNVTSLLLATARKRQPSRRRRLLMAALIIASVTLASAAVFSASEAGAQPCNPRVTPCRTPTPSSGATRARVTIAGRIDVKTTLQGVAITPDGGKLYANNFNEQRGSVVDSAKMA